MPHFNIESSITKCMQQRIDVPLRVSGGRRMNRRDV